jgi:hypothetical protein
MHGFLLVAALPPPLFPIIPKIASNEEIRGMQTPKRKSASAQAEEREIAAQIARADYFTAHLRVGPHEKYTERADSYEGAVEAGNQLKAQHSRFGRSAVIYAVNSLGSFDCTPELIALARSL